MQNIRFLFDLACQRELHLDFHLDYNLDRSTQPLVWFVMDEITARITEGIWKPTQHLCIGHATRLTLWDAVEWQTFTQIINDRKLPVTLVGLPQSDVYMMGRHMPSPPRSTLNVPRLMRTHALRVAMAVNNVGNAFTPQGSADPLALCPLGVALFQAGTKEDCCILLVSPSQQYDRHPPFLFLCLSPPPTWFQFSIHLMSVNWQLCTACAMLLRTLLTRLEKAGLLDV